MPRGKKFCFYIAPIGEEGTPVRMQSDTALDYIVRPALADRYRIKRADEDVVPRQISPQLIRDINDADLIVCDLTGLNANVMYELGVAHTLAKPVIQIADGETRLPFDLMQFRTVFFNGMDPQSHRKAGAEIRSAEEGLRRAKRISNLVTDSIDGLTYDDIRSGTSAYHEKLERLIARVGELEQREGRASDPVGRTIKLAERALKTAVPSAPASAPSGKGQAEAAGRVIDLLAGRAGFERVAVDRTNARRLIVYGDAPLGAADVAGLIKGFDVELRPARRA